MQQLMILLVISSPSTCFGRLYAHRQEVRLRFHCLSFSVLLCGSIMFGVCAHAHTHQTLCCHITTFDFLHS